jgi:dihydrofolate reductase
MKVVVVMVASLNGKTTDGGLKNIHSWTSKEDADSFAAFLAKQKLIVMGSRTYEAAKKQMRILPGQLRIVLTKSPTKYHKQAIPGVLEFHSLSARALVGKYSRLGYKTMALVGGAKTNRSFFASGLVDELRLTLEPYIFGSGEPIVLEGKFREKFSLISKKQINSSGTLELVYRKIAK